MLLLAGLWDLLLGELPVAVHPVVAMGKAIAWLRDRSPQGVTGRLLWGAGMSALLMGAAWLLGGWVESLEGPWLRWPLGTALLTASFAGRELYMAGDRVRQPLAWQDLSGAREALSMIVSRDTAELDEGQIAAGAAQTLAENLSDSIVAPLFWFALFGLPGALAYRVANTMDAMVGYRDKYEFLGKVPARVDDLLNFVPARITALLLYLVGRLHGRDGAPTWSRDRWRTPSPNGGHPMAMVAGILGRRLEKPGVYSLGDGQPPDDRDLGMVQRLVVEVGLLSWALTLAWGWWA